MLIRQNYRESKMGTCKDCKNWVSDLENKQDKLHADQDRKLCTQTVGEFARGLYYHADTPACRKYSDNERGYKVG